MFVLLLMCVVCCIVCVMCYVFFFFQAEDGIRDLVRSRGLGDVYKRQVIPACSLACISAETEFCWLTCYSVYHLLAALIKSCLLYTSDAADERSSVDLGGRRIIKKKQKQVYCREHKMRYNKHAEHGIAK